MSTSGVYTKEMDAFPSTIIGVRTAVPCFIGYTEKTPSTAPTLLQSLDDFESKFGGGPPVGGAQFNLYYSVSMFFANGGSSCYVVSAGLYGKGVVAADLEKALSIAGSQSGVTMLAIPDAVLLPPDDPSATIPTSKAFASLVQKMIAQAGQLQDRIAILDVYGADSLTGLNLTANLMPLIKAFQESVGDNDLSYGAAYFPFLDSTVSPTLVPPSGAIAGTFAQNDFQRGVWNAPANMTLAATVSPNVILNEEQQGKLNVPLNGKAVDVIRQFPGYGTVVWGARTLDGNNNDWRYIQVRRTVIYIEQSIKQALAAFVFAANSGQTWATVTSLISNFLTNLWSQGGLMGDTASEAFTVQCGLGSTMTGQDILDGYMIVQVTLQMIHPAEFIELTFRQRMQGA